MTEQGRQILKTRDDPAPVYMECVDSSRDAQRPFRLFAQEKCSWVAESSEPFGTQTLRPRIEPWLTALVQSEHLSLLVGSGLTHAVHYLANCKPMQGMRPVELDVFKNEIETESRRIAVAAQREKGNFEDQFRVAADLLRGLEISAADKPSDHQINRDIVALRGWLNSSLESFADTVLSGEQDLVTAKTPERELAFNYLVRFLMSFASRTGTRERLHLFTTNYDRFIEAGADTAGLRLIDRFVGTLGPVFRASRLDIDLHYNPPGIRGEPRYLEGVAYFTKLHGSVDWIDCERTIRRIGLPFGARDPKPFLDAAGVADAPVLMIYPNAAKDRETTAYPYVELFRDFAAAVCRPNSTLVCYGYSFGDEHINRVIEDMLTIPSSHLVIVSYDDPLKRIIRTFDRVGRHAQITLLLGDHLGDLQTLVDHYLPKPAIDRATIRMAELLKARWNTRPDETGSDPSIASDENGTAQ